MRTQLEVAARALKLANFEKIKIMAIFASFYFNLVVKLKKSADASGHGARNTFWFFFPILSRFTKDRNKRASDFNKTLRKESFELKIRTTLSGLRISEFFST